MMQNNIAELVERQGNLVNLDIKARDLGDEADQFKKGAKGLE